MKLLKLFLTVPERAEPGEFQINADSEAGQIDYHSRLPFFEDDKRWRTTIIKILGAGEFRPEDFPIPQEQNWMLERGLLVEQNSTHFSQNIRQIIGQEIYESLFPKGRGRELLQRMLAISGSRERLHLQLGFSDKIERRSRLPDYPWELACTPAGFLVEGQVVFSRFIGFLETTPKLPPVEKINVLLVSSLAFDKEMGLGFLGSQEQNAVLRGLKKAEEENNICIKQLRSPTFKELGDYLTENTGEQAPHIIHFDGHGFFGQRCDNCRTIHRQLRVESCRQCGQSLEEKIPQGYLLFQPKEGERNHNSDYVSAKEISTLLHQTSLEQAEEYGVRLVVLSACKTSVSLVSESLFNGLAQSLIQHQVPAVLAMQYNVTVGGAISFSERFYRAIGNYNLLTTAVSLGQQAMGIEGNQWYRPVLYLRWHDNERGRLFFKPNVSLKSTSSVKAGSTNNSVNRKKQKSTMNLKELITNGILNELAISFNDEDMADILLNMIDFPGHMRPIFPSKGRMLGYWQRICQQIQNGVVPSGNDLQSLVDAAADIYPANTIFQKYRS